MRKRKGHIYRLHRQRGFVALTAVLVISFVVLAVATSISLLGVGEAKNSLDFKRGQETLKIAEGCIEEALLRLKKDASYTGTAAPLPVGGGSCTISVTGAGSDRTITVEAEVSGQPLYRKKVQATVRRVGGSINIVSWSEI